MPVPPARRTPRVVVVLVVAVAGATLVAAAGCGVPAGTEVRANDVPRAESTRAEQQAAVAAVTAFGVDLYRQLAARDADVVVSPWAIATSLAMAQAGAESDTYSQISKVLHAEQVPALDRAIGSVGDELASRDGERQSEVRRGRVDLAVPSAVWFQQGTAFEDGYLASLAADFDSGARVVDFRSDPEAARRSVNRWADEQTSGTVSQLLARGTATQLTRFSVTSAATLRAPWEVAFAPDGTTFAPFRLADASSVSVPSMTLTDRHVLRAADGDGWQAVELPYLGGELSMTVVVPTDGSLAELDQRLDGPLLDAISGSLAPTAVELHLPRFGFTTGTSLDDALGALGMADAFSRDAADFGGITADEQLAVSDVVHQSFLAVDEQGSDAAAATVVRPTTDDQGGATARRVVVDRPFLFVVRDTETGALLLLGRVGNPLG